MSKRVSMFLLLLCLLPQGRAWAQQAIINLPSADVTPKGRHFLMMESQSSPWNPADRWSNVNFYTYGVGKSTELTVTSYNLGLPRTRNFTLGFGVKTSPQLFKKRFPEREIKLTVGQIVPVSLQGDGVGNFSYTHLSGRLPKLKTRLTAGVATGTRHVFGKDTPLTVMAALEHPVTQDITLLAEWFSGDHKAAYLIPGVAFHKKGKNERDWIFVMGFRIPNDLDMENSGLVFEIGRFL